MMSRNVLRQAEAIFRRALAVYGAMSCPVYRTEHDANGVPIGTAEQIGCVYGVRYERGQTANVLVDVPGVVARLDAPRLCCALCGCARELRDGDVIQYGGEWYAVLRVDVQMDILADVVLQKGGAPVGISD